MKGFLEIKVSRDGKGIFLSPFLTEPLLEVPTSTHRLLHGCSATLKLAAQEGTAPHTPLQLSILLLTLSWLQQFWSALTT